MGYLVEGRSHSAASRGADYTGGSESDVAAAER
jgi:hypothetical protein